MDPRVLWALRPYCKQKCCIDEYVCIVTSMISLHAATIWQMLIRLDFFGSNNRLLTMDLGSRIWQIFTHTRKTHTPRQNTAPQNPAHPHEHGWIYIITDLNGVQFIYNCSGMVFTIKNNLLLAKNSSFAFGSAGASSDGAPQAGRYWSISDMLRKNTCIGSI